MKVRDLIQELQKLNPELVVCVTNASEWTGPVGSIAIQQVDECLRGHADGQPIGVPYVYLTTED